MSRVKEYHREQVLDAASELFWAMGYEATSINDVVSHTGLNKHSLYKEFGDKEGLYLACLNHYAKVMSQDFVAILAKEPLGLDNIKAFFLNRATYANTKRCRGCFLINAVNDRELLSPKTYRRIQEMLASHDTFFHNCLAAAQGRGDLPKNKDCKAIAGYLSCFLRGLMSVGRSKAWTTPPEKLIEIVMTTIRA